MPIAPRFHLKQLQQFALQISHAPKHVQHIQLQNAEELIFDINEETLYPFDYITFRITGNRESNTKQTLVLGSALLGDLVALLATVSFSMNLPADGMLKTEEIAKRLNVSLRTIGRLKHEGLPFYWVTDCDGKRRLGCNAQSLEKFTRNNKERLDNASMFTRLTKKEKEDLINLALQYQGDKRTLSEVAAEIASDTSRGHETVRSLLKASTIANQLFIDRNPLTRSDAREIENKLQTGVSWYEIEQDYQCTSSALRKAIARLRMSRLKQLSIDYVFLEVFTREDAEEVILGAPAVVHVSPPIFELHDFEFQSNSWTDAEEITVISAMHLLNKRAQDAIQLLPYSPSEKKLDRIETDLRWSFLLLQALVIEAMPSALFVAVQHVGRPIGELPEQQMFTLLHHVIGVVGKSCLMLDPTKGHTARKTPSSILDRKLTLLDHIPQTKRASAKNKEFTFPMPYADIAPWSSLIQCCTQKERLQSEELHALYRYRNGLNGKPLTVEEIANVIHKTPNWIARRLRGN